MRTRLTLTTLAVAAASLLALAPSAGAFITRAPIGSFGMEGGSCTGFSLATGTGDLNAAVGRGDLTTGSTTVSNLTTSAGTFAAGMRISGAGIPDGTTIDATPPGALTLSAAATSTVTGSSFTAGFLEVTSVSTNCGSFRVGQSISGAGIPNGTTITAVGATLTLSSAPTFPGTGVALTGTSVFGAPNGLAFHQATDRLYVFDTGPDRIYALDTSTPGTYAPLGGNFPITVSTGGDADIAVDNTAGASAGRIFYPAPPKVYAFDSTGTELRGSTGFPNFPISISGSSNLPGAAVDTASNIWFTRAGLSFANQGVMKFDSAGTPPGAYVVGVSRSNLQEGPSSVAVDANDNLYVGGGTVGGRLFRYIPADGYATATQVLSGDNFRQLSIDMTASRVYAVGNSQGYALDSTGASLYRFGQVPSGTSLSPTGVAIDEATDLLYVSNSSGSKVWVFGPPADYPDASGTLNPATNVRALTADVSATVDDNSVLATNWRFEISEDGVTWRSAGGGVSGKTQGSQTGVAVGGTITGLHNNTTYHFRLVTDKGPGSTDVPHGDLTFHTETIPDAGVTLNPAQNVTTNSADLSATIDDNGPLPTNWRFEISKNAGATWTTRGSGSTAGGGSGVAVASTATSLDPSTVYQFRIIVNKGPGTDNVTFGPLDFKTDPVPPALSLVGTVRVTDTSAYLVGAVNPNGGDSKYHFEYGAVGPCDANACASTAETGVGSGIAPVNVSQFVSGLDPDTTYHLRLIADNLPLGGTTTSANLTFHTLAVPPPAPTRRAFEMVSPPDKNNGGAFAGPRYATVAYDGQAAGFCTSSLFGDPSGTQGYECSDYVSSRSADGWHTRAVNPPFCRDGSSVPNVSVVQRGVAFSLNMDRAAITQPESDACSIPPLDPDAPLPGKNFYLEDLISEPTSYELLAPEQPSGRFGAASDDFAHIAYTSEGLQSGDAPAGSFSKVFEWDEGTVRLVSVRPDGAPFTAAAQVGGGVPGPVTERALGDGVNAVSDDGSRIFFETPLDATQEIYMREGGTRTHWVSQQECSPACSDTAAPDAFRFAAPDGSRAFFTTSARLTNADTSATGSDLYLYTHSADPVNDANLTLLSRDNEAGDGTRADVLDVLGLSDTGETVYFAASGQLVAGRPTAAGPKLYRWRWNGGSPTLDYLATLDSAAFGDVLNWEVGTGQENRIVTPDGTYLLIRSVLALDPIADRDSDVDIYRWGEAAGWLCVSCQLPGTPSAGGSSIALQSAVGGAVFGAKTAIRRIVMSDDGQRVFFTTRDALLSADTNGTIGDVYEWHDGTLSLVSSGTGQEFDPILLGAGHTGEDVFFTTELKLVGWDTDDAVDVYDARIGGGFPEPLPVDPPCDLNAGACEGAPSATPAPTGAGSREFQGAVDPLPIWRKSCPKGKRKVERRGKVRCVPRRRQRKNRSHRRGAEHGGRATR